MTNLAVFASGTGSNFTAILDAIDSGQLQANCTLLVSDCPDARVVGKAGGKQIPTFTFSPKAYPGKEHYEKIILSKLHELEIDWIVLAGYMRLIGPTILSQFPRRILNIHPSLLPAFKGLDAVGQAMEAGVKITGVTIHYVDEGMDTGAIIAQKALDISSMNTREDIERSLHKIEHELYPITIEQLLNGYYKETP